MKNIKCSSRIRRKNFPTTYTSLWFSNHEDTLTEPVEKAYIRTESIHIYTVSDLSNETRKYNIAIESLFWSVFTHVASSYVNFLELHKVFT